MGCTSAHATFPVLSRGKYIGRLSEVRVSSERHILTILNLILTDSLLTHTHTSTASLQPTRTHRIILGSSLIQLVGGEEQRDEGHTCHSSPNGDASWETQHVSKFGSSWVIVSSQPRMAPGLACDSISLAIYTSITYISI